MLTLLCILAFPRAKSVDPDTSEVKLPEYQHMDTIVIDPESDDVMPRMPYASLF